MFAPKTIKDVELSGKNVLVRLDLDVPIRDGKVDDDSRLAMIWPTVEKLMAAEPKRVTIIGHLGRPTGNSEFIMEPVRNWYRNRLKGYQNWELWENLRFDPGEETNSQSFAEDIVRRSGAQVYVFEAFATAHERHASIISVPKMVSETFVGFRFGEEIRNLSKIWQNPKRPVVFVLGGAKVDTKIGLIGKLAQQADEVLIGGLLPTKLGSVCLPGGKCLTVARLNQTETDIAEEEAERFRQVILKAGTAVWNGPMGAFEKGASGGTLTVAKAMRETEAFTVAGGGDTEAALTKLGGSKGIDWISSGGGAMLYYLAHHTLPLLEALK